MPPRFDIVGFTYPRPLFSDTKFHSTVDLESLAEEDIPDHPSSPAFNTCTALLSWEPSVRQRPRGLSYLLPRIILLNVYP